MPSAFTHSIFAIALGKTFSPLQKQPWKFWLLAMFCASIPDADVIAFRFGIPYSDMFGHRGITHSIFFSFLLGFVVTLLFYPKIRRFSKTFVALTLFFGLATLSHALLDMLTNGGLGCALFAPFSAERYFFPVRPIKVAPLSAARFFTERGLRVFQSEFMIVWLPCLLIIFIAMMYRFLNIKPAVNQGGN